MGLLKKFIKFGRAIKDEFEEEFTDSQAIRLLEQDIRDARLAMENAGQARIDLAGKKKLSHNNLTSLNEEISKYEAYATEALEKGDETLATEIAEKIATLETRQKEDQEHFKTVSAEFDLIEETIRQSKAKLSEMERQLAQIKATDAVQKAQEKISSLSLNAGASVSNAADAIKRIKEKQQEKRARFAASAEIDEQSNSLDKKIASSLGGAKSASANDILARLRKKK